MLEWYRAFSAMADVMRDTEELVFELATPSRERPW